jgi:hypothetical protein
MVFIIKRRIEYKLFKLKIKESFILFLIFILFSIKA